MFFDFDYVLLGACLIAAAYSTPCTNSDFDTFKTCINTTAPRPTKEQIKQQMDVCFTTYACPIPVYQPRNHTHDKSSSEEKASKEGSGSKEKGSHGNKTLWRECNKQRMESIVTFVQTCVQQNIPGFVLPKFEEHKRGKHGGQHGQHGGKQGGHHRFNETECPMWRNVSQCQKNVMEQNFNKSKLCETAKTCKPTNCAFNETEQIVCNCSKTIPQANLDQVTMAFSQCLGKNATEIERVQQHKAKGKAGNRYGFSGMFCNRHMPNACDDGERNGHHASKGGPGKDTFKGGPGKDTFKGGPGKDTFKGGPGKDTSKGGPGKDTFKGGPGKGSEGK